jgi:hypothetical protein
MLNNKNKEARARILRRKGLRVRMWESVMKLGYEWISVNKPRGETPAPPPEKRAPALPPRRLARGIGIGPPLANWLVSACWEGSKNWFGYLEGRFRPKAAQYRPFKPPSHHIRTVDGDYIFHAAPPVITDGIMPTSPGHRVSFTLPVMDTLTWNRTANICSS